MPSFPAFTITALGLDMMAQAELGGTLTFTRIALGAGAAPDPAAATDLVDERMTEDIQTFTNMGGGSVRLRSVFSNLTLVTGFGMSEVGVFALDPTTSVEKLYSYTNISAPDTPDYMPPSTGPVLLEQIFDAIIGIGSATSVTAVIDDTVIIATKEDAMPAIMPRVTIGAGGAAAVDLIFDPSPYDEISIIMSGLFKQSCKAYLQADSADGVQEIIEISSSVVVGSKTTRAWLSKTMDLPTVAGEVSLSDINYYNNIAVLGNYAYVTNFTANTMSVVNISVPASPVIVGTPLAGFGGPYAIAVLGNYAYVTNFTANTMSVVNITTPASPSIVGTLTGLSGPYAVAVSGSYAYVTNSIANTMSVVSIATPASPSIVGTLTGLSNPQSIVVSGSYAYIANITPNTMSVVNIATPASPSIVGTLSGLSNPQSIAVSGSYAYVTNATDDTMSVVSIATPASPSIVGTLTGLGGPKSVTVSGNYAYVTNNTDDTMSVVDISVPASPVIARIVTGLNSPSPVAVLEDYAYIGNTGDDTMSIFSISTPSGGKVSLWPSNGPTVYFEMVIPTNTGQTAFRATGSFPALTTKLTISSLLAGGLLEGGTIVIRGRKLA